jgi:hypothetical protein
LFLLHPLSFIFPSSSLISFPSQALPTFPGLYFISFGPSFSFLLLHILYGSKFSETSASSVLGVYCIYVFFMAINGKEWEEGSGRREKGKEGTGGEPGRSEGGAYERGRKERPGSREKCSVQT